MPKKIYTRTFFYLIDDVGAPGGARLGIIELEYETDREGKRCTDTAAHMELARRFPDIQTGTVQHVATRDRARIEDDAPAQEPSDG